ncbi:MAG: PorT family protein [Bacteroidales bacterium]|jgi:hypothetical protein|nr:PorT family protein [Bacteroidales bacterium]
MKNIAKVSLLVVTLLIGSNSFAQDFKFGFKFGPNFSNLKGDNTGDLNAKVGFQAGATVDYNVKNNWFCLSGLEYTIKGAKDGDFKANPMYIQMPVHAAYKFQKKDGYIRLVPRAGLHLGVGVGGKLKNGVETDFFDDNAYKRFDFGFGVGFDFEIKNCVASIGYDRSLVNISDVSGVKQYNSNCYLTIGYKFKYY